jgi:hypothetical protein
MLRSMQFSKHHFYLINFLLQILLVHINFVIL